MSHAYVMLISFHVSLLSLKSTIFIHLLYSRWIWQYWLQQYAEQLSNMNLVKWLCSPWVLPVQWIARIMYQSNRSLNIPPLGNPPRHLKFWKIFAQIPPSRDWKPVQIAHYRSIPGDQMPPSQGNFSVASIMLQKLCMKTLFNRQHSYMPKIIQLVLEYLQMQSKACASLCSSASPPQIGYLSLWMHQGLSPPWYITPRGIRATLNIKSRLAIKFPTPYE